jgi:hypothetical protein
MERIDMKCPSLVLLPLLLLGCKSTKALDARQPSADEEVHITADELEPIGRFVLQTRRVLVAEFVLIEMSQQFFAAQMGFTRDQQAVVRKTTRLEKPVGRFPAGTTRIELTNVSDQGLNINPDFLPRVYFGSSGLEVRAYRKLVIYLVPAKDKKRPLFVDVLGKMSTGNARLWTGGRLTDEKPEIHVRAELLWSEDKEEYKHVASVG